MLRALVISIVVGLSLTPALATPNGSVDLSGWNPNTSTHELVESWLVARGKLVPTADIANPQHAVSTGHWSPTKLPDIWGPGLTDHVASGHGHATYRLRLKLPHHGPPLALDPGILRSIAEIDAIVWRGADFRIVELARNGDPKNALLQRNSRLLIEPILLPSSEGELEIVIRLTNRVHKQGGVIVAPSIGSLENIYQSKQRTLLLNTVLTTLFFVLGVGSLLMSSIQKQQRTAYILVGCLGFIICLRIIFVSDLAWPLFPTLGLSRKYDFEYAIMFALALAFYQYVVALLPRAEWVPASRIFQLTFLCLISFALIAAPHLPPGTITLTREPFALLGVALASTILCYAVLSILRAQNTMTATIVVASCLTSFTYEILVAFGILTFSMDITAVMALSGSTLYVVAMTKKFREILQEREANSRTLGKLNKDLKGQQFQLLEARKKAEDAAESKGRFVANVSHEIRTPLNGIIGAAQVLSMSDLDREQQKSIDMLLSSGRSLLAVVNDVLDISKAEDGPQELQNSSFKVETLVEEATRSLQALTEQKGLHLSCVLTPDARGDYVGDPKRIRQILLNLLGNAVKFTESGVIAVAVKRLENGNLYFLVSDTGPGIPEDQLSKIFGRFRQVDGGSNTHPGGTGLGLNISKQFVEMMGGEIGVSSAPGEGTRFWFKLPLERAASKSAKAPLVQAKQPQQPLLTTENDAEEKHIKETTTPSDGLLIGKNILVVDDHPLNRSLIEALLKPANVDIHMAENGEEALAALTDNIYDVVLLDANMPVMNGWKTLERLRAGPTAWQRQAVIMLTGETDRDVVNDFFALGANGFVAKPIERDLLISELVCVLNKHRTNTQAERIRQSQN